MLCVEAMSNPMHIPDGFYSIVASVPKQSSPTGLQICKKPAGPPAGSLWKTDYSLILFSSHPPSFENNKQQSFTTSNIGMLSLKSITQIEYMHMEP